MALVAVHLNPDPPFQVLGVWLSPTVAAYLHTSSGGAAREVGSQVMARMGADVLWDDWCTMLAEKLPTVALWHAQARADGEEARHVLARMVATEAVNRRAAAGW